MVRRRTILGGVSSLAVFGFWAQTVDWESDDEMEQVPEPEVQSDGVHRQGSWLDLDQATVEQAIHEQVNEVRDSKLEYSDQLGRIARYHSWNMYEQGFYAHESPDGQGLSDRYGRFGYNCSGGENIFQTWAFTQTINYDGETVTYSSADELANGTVEEWMNSEGHRENLLDRRWREEGIGVWWAPDQENGGVQIYITQNFC